MLTRRSLFGLIAAAFGAKPAAKLFAGTATTVGAPLPHGELTVKALQEALEELRRMDVVVSPLQRSRLIYVYPQEAFQLSTGVWPAYLTDPDRWELKTPQPGRLQCHCPTCLPKLDLCRCPSCVQKPLSWSGNE